MVFFSVLYCVAVIFFSGSIKYFLLIIDLYCSSGGVVMLLEYLTGVFPHTHTHLNMIIVHRYNEKKKEFDFRHLISVLSLAEIVKKKNIGQLITPLKIHSNCMCIIKCSKIFVASYSGSITFIRLEKFMRKT